MASKLFRISQFVTTYGPGSLVRMEKSHRVIPGLQILVDDLKKQKEWAKITGGLEEFRIHDDKLEKIIRERLTDTDVDLDEKQVRIFKLPTNADMKIPEGKQLYGTIPFPQWSVCTRNNHNVLGKSEWDGSRWILKCPKCDIANTRGHKFLNGIPARFIRACHRGHMDDIDWQNEVHQGAECSGQFYEWDDVGNGRSLTVTCITCNKKTTYSAISRRSFRSELECSGRSPEIETRLGTSSSQCFESVPGTSEVRQTGRLTLINASSLRVTSVLSSVLIPPYSDRIYKILFPLSTNLAVGLPNYDEQTGFNSSKDELVTLLKRKQQVLGVTNESLRVLDEVEDSYVTDMLDKIFKSMKSKTMTEEESDDQEFEMLTTVSQHGYPKPYDGKPADFLVPKEKIETFHNKMFDLDFVVAPIEILYVTDTQLGYSREVKLRDDNDSPTFTIRPTGDLVPSYYKEDKAGSANIWFCGTQRGGEGIFIHAKDHDVFKKKDKSAYDAWMNLSAKQTDPEMKKLTNPNYIWWHSLAHRLVNDLSIDSGFQSAAINEKTYSVIKGDTAQGGILLFANQPGGDGTLGSLTGLVPMFNDILNRSAERLMWCSNDPICINRQINPNRINGASCHACMTLPETSCRKMNKFLDRKLLKGALI